MSISPNVPTPQESYHYESTGTPRWIAVLFGVLIVAVLALGYMGHSAQSQLQADLAKAQDQNKIQSDLLKEANSRLADLKANMEVTQQKVGLTAAELAKTKSRAEAIRKEQVESDQKLSTQLTEVQKESTQKIGEVATDLGGAKKDIESTRSDLEATKGKLDRATGDMGVMSGLIAHNRDDLEELKRRGDRNYYEFKVSKSKTPAARRPGASHAEQGRPEESQVHHDRLRRRPLDREERQDRRRAGAVLSEGRRAHGAVRDRRVRRRQERHQRLSLDAEGRGIRRIGASGNTCTCSCCSRQTAAVKATAASHTVSEHHVPRSGNCARHRLF